MVPIDTIIQETLLVLRDPAWQGAGVMVSSALSLFAIHYSRQFPLKKIPRGMLCSAAHIFIDCIII